MERWEVLANKIYDMLKDRNLAFVFAPTGYGKTMVSPYLYELMTSSGLASRLIHVVPIRALLREIYMEKFRHYSNRGLKLGYQSMDRIPGGDKSPYFLADITVTTLDSFLWNMYKIPVAEFSKVIREVSDGHYYPALASIITSVVVFDEAHIYLGEPGESGGEIVVVSALEALKKLRVPTVLATATMSSNLVKAFMDTLNLRGEDIGVIYACEEECNNHVKALEKLGLVVEYVDSMSSNVSWTTKIFDSTDDELTDEIKKYCNDRVTLVVANTVDRAVKLYRELRTGCRDVTLIHSRLIEKEREEAYNMIRDMKESGRGLIVASPIIEVGVEIDADVLVTDAAPVENLAQRAGRLCRGRKEKYNAEVIIVSNAPHGPYNSDEVVKALQAIRNVNEEGKCIEWRLFNSKVCRPIIDIIDSVARKPNLSKSILLTNYLVSDSKPSTLLDEININNLFRGLSLIKIAVDGVKCGSSNNKAECLSENSFTTSIETLKWLEPNRKCLSTHDNILKILALTTSKGRTIEYDIEPLSLKTLHETIYGDKPLSLKRVYQEMKYNIRNKVEDNRIVVDFFLELRPECYKQGEGAYV